MRVGQPSKTASATRPIRDRCSFSFASHLIREKEFHASRKREKQRRRISLSVDTSRLIGSLLAGKTIRGIFASAIHAASIPRASSQRASPSGFPIGANVAPIDVFFVVLSFEGGQTRPSLCAHDLPIATSRGESLGNVSYQGYLIWIADRSAAHREFFSGT